MPIDNRKVLQNIRIPVTTENPVRRVLTAKNADEISSMFSQEQLDGFVKEGVLEGDWKASAGKSTSRADLLAQAKELGIEGASKMKNTELEAAIAEASKGSESGE